MEKSSPVDATVVITTKDRKEDLRTAVQSAINQTANVEVLVIDDGSSDGTSAMIHEEFPEVRLHREEESAGLIVRRNQAAKMAQGDIIVSIDDDAEFSSPHVVEQTLPYFEDSFVGAVGIPFIDVKRDPDTVKQEAPDDSGLYALNSFIGTAHAIRRDLFLDLGGYRDFFYHQNEEMDLCLRMLDRGKVVMAGHGDHVIHYKSPIRDHTTLRIYKRRNDLLFSWCNIPGRYLLPHMARKTLSGVLEGIRDRRIDNFTGILRGFGDSLARFGERAPVRPQTHALYQDLKKNGMQPVEKVRPRLP